MNPGKWVTVLLCGCVWISGGCGTPARQRAITPPRQSSQQPLSLPSLRVETERLQLRWLEPGNPSQVVWEAHVPHAQASSAQAGAMGEFENVQCVLYKEGQPTTDLRAGRVRALQKQWQVEASEGVKVYSRVNGLRLRADRVIWLARQNRLIARGNVQITGKQFSLQAREVEMDTALQVMRVVSPER